MINITESAQDYLAELLKKQDCDGISVRIFILDEGTPKRRLVFPSAGLEKHRKLTKSGRTEASMPI